MKNAQATTWDGKTRIQKFVVTFINFGGTSYSWWCHCIALASFPLQPSWRSIVHLTFCTHLKLIFIRVLIRIVHWRQVYDNYVWIWLVMWLYHIKGEKKEKRSYTIYFYVTFLHQKLGTWRLFYIHLRFVWGSETIKSGKYTTKKPEEIRNGANTFSWCTVDVDSCVVCFDIEFSSDIHKNLLESESGLVVTSKYVRLLLHYFHPFCSQVFHLA